MLGVITNPNVALILMMVGIYGLLFELMSPGALVRHDRRDLPAAGPLRARHFAVELRRRRPRAPGHRPADRRGLRCPLRHSRHRRRGRLHLGVAILMDADGLPGFAIYWPLVGGVAVAGIGWHCWSPRWPCAPSAGGRHRPGGNAGRAAEVTDWSGPRRPCLRPRRACGTRSLAPAAGGPAGAGDRGGRPHPRRGRTDDAPTWRYRVMTTLFFFVPLAALVAIVLACRSHPARVRARA